MTHITRTSDAADLAVDDGGDHDEGALEKVLPCLIEAQEDRCILNLNDQESAEQCADEGPAPAQEAGASQDHGGDAA